MNGASNLHAGQIEIDTGNARRWTAAEKLLSLPPDFRIMRSNGIAWLDPLPTFDWYQHFYNEHYLFQDFCLPYEETPSFIRRRLGYFAARIERINQMLGRKPDDLLEIGSGDGLFLVAARNAAIDARGVDISQNAVTESQQRHNVDVLHGDLLRSQLPLKDNYDAVVLNHVLEHLLTPLHYLAHIRDLLKPDGLLAIEIPQQFINPIDLTYRGLHRHRHFSAYSLHHPYFYTVSSVKHLIEVAGFEVVHLTTWLPGQVFHVQNRVVTAPAQGLLWFADRIGQRGHIIELFARPV